MGLIDEKRASIKASLVRANYRLAWVADLVLHFLVDFVTDVIETFLDKNDLVDVVKLRKDDVLVAESYWI